MPEKILLIDGVKYKEWTPEGENAEEELEQMVKEHAQDIFGENSVYLDKKQKLKSLAGVGSIPDGLVIMFGNVPEWHIVEVELSSHDPYGHIVPQVDRFLNGIDNRDTRNKIIEALYDAIYGDEFLKLKTRQAIGTDKDVHKFISDLIARPPTITIVIEEYTSQLREALKKYTQKNVVEFQTFMREGVGLSVHAHLFEPLYKPLPELPPLPPEKTQINQSGSLVITLPPSSIKNNYIHLPENARRNKMFPLVKTNIQIDTDKGNLETEHRISNPHGILKSSWLEGDGLDKWFKAHPELKAGDKIRISVIEPMKKYRLEIVK